MFEAKIRELHVEEAASMAAIEQSAHQHPWSLTLIEQTLRQSGHFAYGAFLHDALIGYYVFQVIHDEGHLLNLCVSPTYQGRGYGTLLMSHFVQQAKLCELRSLLLEVRASNQAAIHLYRKFGFEVVGQRPNYYPTADGRETALLMTCALVSEAGYNSRLC
ncbi:MAG: ribosomal-protein-alanine N-acetyltransferase [Gammaproteobacteria bacterium]|nr:MAG: ribosomal-protein-alanine N-acetyltransferase [Gammaproteobacteria bacterium]